MAIHKSPEVIPIIHPNVFESNALFADVPINMGGAIYIAMTANKIVIIDTKRPSMPCNLIAVYVIIPNSIKIPIAIMNDKIMVTIGKTIVKTNIEPDISGKDNDL